MYKRKNLFLPILLFCFIILVIYWFSYNNLKIKEGACSSDSSCVSSCKRSYGSTAGGYCNRSSGSCNCMKCPSDCNTPCKNMGTRKIGNTKYVANTGYCSNGNCVCNWTVV